MTLYLSPQAAKRAGHAALHARRPAAFRVQPGQEVAGDRSRTRGWIVVLVNRRGERSRPSDLYTIRHTNLSRLAVAAWKWAGHKVITTTQRYIKLAPRDLDDLTAALDARVA